MRPGNAGAKQEVDQYAARAAAHKERNRNAGCVQPEAKFKAKMGWLK